jgi:hypothetical protein
MSGSTLELEIQDHREAVWAKLSEELGGKFIDQKGWAKDYVQIQYENWHVTLDFEVHAGYRSEYIHTRFHSPVRPSAFRVTVFHQDLIHKVGRLFGMQDFQVGDAAFNRTFVVQSTDKVKVRQLFQDAELRRLMVEEPELEIRLRVPSVSEPTESCVEWDQLTLQVPGIVEDMPRLRRLFDVFAHLVRELQKAGAEPC